MKRLLKEFTKGITIENPTFGLVLGLCPALAVSTSVYNALGMGAAATFVLVGSNIIISAVRKVIPDQIRIPCYIVIIATFVTIVELLMKAYMPSLDRALGIFVPLIVVNCIVLGRAEAFASKNNVLHSFCDGLGMGVGFTLALCLIASIREVLGSGKFLGMSIMKGFEPAIMMVLAPGALLTMGLLIGLVNYWQIKRKSGKEIRRAGCHGCG
ncbi:MAG: electron transport complex subunit RsxE [Omnitrophica WOR_2 bacterium GWF2_43_52]|nr:MAG: electron transport complex subunit RsxE [Omnitrophica WOR_2 bacterium GWA2_44_7]OGX17273.1 MAG: electron transport complex subunit RsxE [Omnitrophica WOR_2 bacterium GWC2_44_8]OGX22743.1 MAG: electron transport complex subunit RsxE [Omnitrophica WOR_2 bacterium GWF2_43_52]OGX55921.1 MAG: electron transport complex subunit RsxE [Omnitrophica WOR_2 bacterium RIFOXYC2_FULL_43_9]HAH19558.1 electron transport complex subunit RsxE [Candidatus Omnitrophota bacterium]